MRSISRCAALLPLFLLVLALPAHADPMNDFSITGGGATIDFSLPATTTGQFQAPIGQDNFGQVSGTVNGVSELIGVNFITGFGCAECGTVLVNYPSTGWTIDIPSGLYTLTPAGALGETLTFNPGDYMAVGYNNSQPFGHVPFEIKVTSDAAATPEPATIFSLITAALALPLLRRRRVVTS